MTRTAILAFVLSAALAAGIATKGFIWTDFRSPREPVSERAEPNSRVHVR